MIFLRQIYLTLKDYFIFIIFKYSQIQMKQNNNPSQSINKKILRITREYILKARSEQIQINKEYKFSQPNRVLSQLSARQMLLKKLSEDQSMTYQAIKKKWELEKKLQISKTYIAEIKQYLTIKAINKNQKMNKKVLLSRIERKKELIRLISTQQSRIKEKRIMTQEEKQQIQKEIQNEYKLQIDQKKRKKQNACQQYFEKKINQIYNKFSEQYEQREDVFKQNEDIIDVSALPIYKKQKKIINWIQEEKYNQKKRKIQQLEKEWLQYIAILENFYLQDQTKLNKQYNSINLQLKEKKRQLKNINKRIQTQQNQETQQLLEQQRDDIQKIIKQLQKKYDYAELRIEQLEKLKDERIESIKTQYQQQMRLVSQRKYQSKIEIKWQKIQCQMKQYEIQQNKLLDKQKQKAANNRLKFNKRLTACYAAGKKYIQNTKFFEDSSLKHQILLFKMQSLLTSMQSIQKYEQELKNQVKICQQLQKDLNQLMQNTISFQLHNQDTIITQLMKSKINSQNRIEPKEEETKFKSINKYQDISGQFKK